MPIKEEKLAAIRKQYSIIAERQASSTEDQLKFLKKILSNKDEIKKFSDNPKAYALKSGILLSPKVVQIVVNSMLFDPNVSTTTERQLGQSAYKELMSMRERFTDLSNPTRIAAFPAAIVAAAAVVAAAAAVATLVVTLLRYSGIKDPRVLVSREFIQKTTLMKNLGRVR